MANYVAKVRTNYFKVKDADAWQAFCDRFELTNIVDNQDGETLHGFMDNSLGGGIPHVVWSDEEQDHVEIDFVKEMAEHIEDGWVAIIVEIGSEKFRYFIGFAIAINSKGEVRQVSLDEINKKATELGENITEPAY